MKRVRLVTLSADSARSGAKPLSADSGTNRKVQSANQAHSRDRASRMNREIGTSCYPMSHELLCTRGDGMIGILKCRPF